MLCSTCQTITLERLLVPDTRLKHLADARLLRSSSLSCKLCALFRDAVNQNTRREIDNEWERGMYDHILKPEPLYLSGSFKEDGLYGIHGYLATIDGEDQFELSIFTDRENVSVCGRPLTKSSDSPEAFSMIKSWMRQCASTHEQCQMALSGGHADDTDPILPTRVIDLGASRDPGDLRLLTTQGRRGAYIALSHCWGGQVPNKTLKENIQAYCRKLEVSKLPKNFQDAITVTAELGFRYLWIDALCIVQDDKEDWRKESAKMGMIYQNAALTIGATAGANSGVGLFFYRSPQRRVLLHSSDAYLALQGDVAESTLADSPLESRGWITQEWLLSPRMVHYLKGRLLWTCRNTAQDECGAPNYENQSYYLFEGLQELIKNPKNRIQLYLVWWEVVTEYSRRYLTYETDKLIALQGLVNQIQEITGAAYHSGIWDEYITVQLLWRARSRVQRTDTLAINPSWSWASTMGAVMYHHPAEHAKDVAENVMFVQGGMQVTSYLRETRHVPYKNETGYYWHTMSRSTLRYGTFIQSPEMCLVLTRDRLGANIGWACFDVGEIPTTPVYCLCLSQNQLKGSDGQDGFNVLYLTLTPLGTYKRVGMGEVVEERWFACSAKETVTIV